MDVPIGALPGGGVRAPVLSEDAEPGEVLVWGRSGDAPPRTWRVDAGGVVLGEEPGIVVATRRGEWRWEVEGEEVETEGCELAGAGIDVEPGRGAASRAALVLRSGGERQEVLAPPAGEGVGELQHDAAMIGSVGPYLFLQERTYTYACGAHGNEEVSFTVWDAERGAVVDLLAEVPNVKALQEAAESLLDDLEEDPEAARRDLDPPQLVQVAPVYGARGRLRLTAQLARSTCYACSDGAWSSYSRSAVVPAAWSPARLSTWVSPPPGVRAFLERTPDLTLGGWSRPVQEERAKDPSAPASP